MAKKTSTKKTTSATKPAPKKTVKKTAPAKVAPKKAVVEKVEKREEVVITESKKPTTPKKPLKIRKSYIILVGVIILFAAFIYYFRGLLVAAVVNGQPISRWEIIKEAEKQSGKQSLDNLVRNTLIEQEARKANVSVSDKEIDEQVKKVEKQLSSQGQKLEQVLALQGMTEADLRKLIRLDQLVGKLVGKDIKITDKEVAEYIEKNKEMLPEGQDEATLKKEVAEQLKQQKLSEKVQVWLQKIQKEAKVNYFVNY